MQKKWLYPISLVLLIILLVGYVRLTTTQTDRHFGADSDGRQYVTMAGDTALFGERFAHFAPFCYRVATPWIASQLPGEDVFAKFRLLAWIDAFLMLILAFALMRASGFGHWYSILGMTLYGAVFWTLKFSFFSPCYVDHQSQLIVLLLLWIMVKGWWPLLPVFIFGAFFQKESVFMVVPIIMVYYLQTRGWRWWPLYVVGILAVAACIVPYIILRNNVRLINPAYGTPAFAIQDAWNTIVKTPGYARILVVAVFSGLGILPLIVLSHFRWALTYLRKNLHWLAMIVIGIFLLLGGKDKSRLFLHMLPAIVVVAVAVIRDMQERLPRIDFMAWLSIVLLLHFFISHHFSAFRNFDAYIHRMVPEHSGTQGAQGFTRVVMTLTLFLIANFILRKRQKPLDLESG